MAKLRCTFTIDEEVMKQVSRLCKYLGTNKSAFIEIILKESLATTSSLLSEDDTLASSVVLLTKQLEEVKSMMTDDKFLEFQQNIKEAKNALL
jgi:hypothetical protein